MELMGGEGDDPELGVERCLRDVRATQIYDGSNQIQLGIVARSAFGEEARAA